jgi:hypothetical protein
MDEQVKTSDYDKEYEMPYYAWEANLLERGNDEPVDNAQGYHLEFFKGFASFARAPNENKLMHIQIKK